MDFTEAALSKKRGFDSVTFPLRRRLMQPDNPLETRKAF